MAEYILEILKSQLMVLFSWGPHNFKRLPGDKGLSFQVEGFKYQGKVKVVYDEGQDLFEVHLDNGKIEDMVYADCVFLLPFKKLCNILIEHPSAEASAC